MFWVTEGAQETLQCEDCIKQRAQENPKSQFSLRSVVDPTICAHCQADYGQTELPRVAALPFCDACRQIVYNRPFPGWLKLSFAGLLVLLAGAWTRGAPYIRAVRNLYRAERLADQKQYALAMPLLEDTLKVAPGSEKAILLAAKTYLLGGEPFKAEQVLKRKERYKEGPLTSEVTAVFGRATKAFEKVAEAAKAANANRSVDALVLVREAQKSYPEWPGWSEQIAILEAAAAYDRKDYDRFLAISEEISKRHPQDAMHTGTVASALACEYAVTGDLAFRVQAEEALERARAQATSQGDKIAFDEYSERIRYRLRTREIIGKQEYDRRFRPAQKGK